MASTCDGECTHAEQATKERLATFVAFFQNAPVAMLLLGRDRRIREMNLAAEATFAASSEELKGLRFGNAIRCVNSLAHPNGCGLGQDCENCPVRNAVAKTFETGQGQRQIQASITLGNSVTSYEKHLVISASLSNLSDGRQVLVCIEDITDKRQNEQKLHKALREIKQLKDRLQEENAYLCEEISTNRGYKEIVGQSEVLQLALDKVDHVAGTDANVLLLGETGTGKELFARAIHSQSARNKRPMVKVNCASLPSSLIESELFGHVKGAFTGALANKMGRFELADGGTIFLDEIGELDPSVQTKLLRVLQEGEFERVGATDTIKVDVRVITATNRDVQLAMEEGNFRADLYYRLAVFPVEIPPLSSRREDIPLLVWHFIEKKQRRLGKNINKIPKHVMDSLVVYNWPGNIRELENVVERSLILSSGSMLTLDGALAKPSQAYKPDSPSCNLDDIDRSHIVNILEDCNWRIKGTGNSAERLGLKPSTLRYRMKKLGIQRPANRPR